MSKISAKDFFIIRSPNKSILEMKKSQISTFLHDYTDKHLPNYLWTDFNYKKAIHDASPELYNLIEETINVKKENIPNALRQTMIKYAIRMSTRSTPYGYMAGCSIGTFCDYTNIVFSDVKEKTYRRLDASFINSIIREIQKCSISEQLIYYTNNSLYTIGRQYRYIQNQFTNDDVDQVICAIEMTDYITTILDKARSGATFSQLVETLLIKNITEENAKIFIKYIIDNQLLFSELEPTLTGDPFTKKTLRRLKELNESDKFVSFFNKIDHYLDSAKDDLEVHKYLKNLFENTFINSPRQNILQTDVIYNTKECYISKKVIKEITANIEKLLCLSQATVSKDLKEFAVKFTDRFGYQEVSLLTLFDNDFGIGYGEVFGKNADYSPFLSKLPFPDKRNFDISNDSKIQNVVLSKLLESIRNKSVSATLTDVDLLQLQKGEQTLLPRSIYLFGNLIGTSPLDIDKGNFLFNLITASGPSAATLIGRYCLYDVGLNERIHDCLREEEKHTPYSDIVDPPIYAEIVHLPNGDRVGNILQRPILRSYEIPYCCGSTVENNHQIKPEDILVSVDSLGRVRLRSKRLNREVIPRLSTAHNYNNGVNVYRFLCDVQYQSGSLHIGWDWGTLNEQPFLPRVIYKNIILSRARWLIIKAEFPAYSSIDFIINELSSYQKLPRWVAITEGDNELVLDLESITGRELLLKEFKKQDKVYLFEWLMSPDYCWISDSANGVYSNELIIPCEVNLSSSKFNSNNYFNKIMNSASSAVKRTFEPGSDWIYIKLYGGPKIIDQLLTETIFSFINELQDRQYMDKWFFTRYVDPEMHLRLRIHSRVDNSLSIILKLLNSRIESYLSSNLIKIQIDTYERELERYGPNIIEETESLFYLDSVCTLNYLRHELDSTERWRFAIQSCDTFLNCFGLNIEHKYVLLQKLQFNYLKEHDDSKILRKELNDRYRILKDLIEYDLKSCSFDLAYLLTNQEVSTDQYVRKLLHERTTCIKPIAEQISKKGFNDNELIRFNLIASYIHMTINRIFSSQP